MQEYKIITYSYAKYYEENTNAYAYRPDRKYPRLQRICFWILRKLGAFYLIPTEKRVEINVNDIMARAQRMINDLRMRGESTIDLVFIIGGKQHEELWNSITMRIEVAVPYAHSHRLLNIPAIIVPRIDGMFLIEKRVLREALNVN